MTLQRRLAKLETYREGRQAGPRVILHEIFWQNDNDTVQSIATLANVFTPSGWQMINRGGDEPEADFLSRAEAMSGDAVAKSASVSAERPRKH